ncbi:hypothetical protein L195_g034226 [Trifolium pratense]|uniref:Uncharacterized protein n=1 Tax=Trifolium pratense TaxID=57577 RepID=A0A2K3LI96_TRIPR|nr:hypothetical protein L195_g034226 [Trifolium pratense]
MVPPVLMALHRVCCSSNCGCCRCNKVFLERRDAEEGDGNDLVIGYASKNPYRSVHNLMVVVHDCRVGFIRCVALILRIYYPLRSFATGLGLIG